MAYANDGDGAARQRKDALALHETQGTLDILADGRGVAPGAVGPADAVSLAPGGVDMVVADGGRDDEPNARAFEQGCVAAGTGADDEGIGIAYSGSIDGGGRERHHLTEGAQRGEKIRDMLVNDDFHSSGIVAGRRGSRVPC